MSPASRDLPSKVGYALTCVVASLILLASGASYYLVSKVSQIGGSHAIVSGPSIGTQNILLMGLESRTDWNGNVLPWSILKHLHAGSYNGVKYQGVGGQATNTLILIHIPAGGKWAVGVSIPRDDWVQFPTPYDGQSSGKIDQAYGLALAAAEAAYRTAHPNAGQDQVALVGNEAGQRAAIDTVEALTGVHIDHFAVVNLVGFYELAKVLGGVYVCIKNSDTYAEMHDPYAGTNLRHGYQHLDASQALAFVRERHNLPNGDIDRTKRQQAFIDSVLHQLRTEGILSDLSKLSALLAVAKRYVITDAGWNLLDFATQMKGLTGGHLHFKTAPITGYAQIDGQDANVINPAQIKAFVHHLFTTPPPGARHGHHRAAPAAPRGGTTVDVRNGGTTPGLAARVLAAAAKAGFRAGTAGNTSARTTTAVEYGTGPSAAATAVTAANAAIIAKALGVSATASRSVAAGHVLVLLGASATVPSIPPPHPRRGGAKVVMSHGIPCVA